MPAGDPNEDLICDACPAGRDEADLQRIYRASRDWRPDPAARTQPPPAVMKAVTDKEYQRAMRARSLIACRRVVPDVFEAVLPLITDSDSAVRTPRDDYRSLLPGSPGPQRPQGRPR